MVNLYSELKACTLPTLNKGRKTKHTKSVQIGDVISSIVKEFHWYQFPTSLFHDGDPYHKETSLLICRANRWTGFYMIEISVTLRLCQDFIIIYLFVLIFHELLADLKIRMKLAQILVSLSAQS